MYFLSAALQSAPCNWVKKQTHSPQKYDTHDTVPLQCYPQVMAHGTCWIATPVIKYPAILALNMTNIEC